MTTLEIQLLMNLGNREVLTNHVHRNYEAFNSFYFSAFLAVSEVVAA
jgi:hypothetical protein